jgi:hypothetical protein
VSPSRISAITPSRLGHARPEQEEGGAEERQGIDDHRERRAEGADQHAPQPRAGHLGRRRGHLELAVGVEKSLLPDERRDERQEGHIEQHREGSREQGHGVQEFDGEGPEGAGQRDGQQERGAGHVGGDHDRPAREAIDPYPREEADDQDGRGAGGREHAHLPGRGPEHEGGDEG